MGWKARRLTRFSGKAAAVTDGRQAGPFLELADFKRAFSRFREDQITDNAAALTYYSLLSLFPALLFCAALLGTFGQQGLIDHATSYLRDAGAPQDTVDAVKGALSSAQDQRGKAVVALIIGLVISLNGASGAFGAAGRALNVIFRVEEGRGFVRRKATDLAWTLCVMVLALITMVLIFLGGGLAADVLGKIGLGDTGATIWLYVRWPAALAVTMTIYAIVYYAAPNVEVRHFRWISAGAVVGVVLWILASALFFVYVSNFSSYSATYGAFAGAVILIVWLWVTNLALLFGAELNAVIDLRRSPHLSETYDGPVLPAKEPAEA
ncbi:YihY/virulence factor BrkB family protein [Solirubrobacter ginsenosidimutans]|uniref:YihY/virulence factor BrkB family protein n=1 Tax=Solirubrobacter ginsenosidimutans TaxID=490573 RepID=A0A9X3S4Y2_9ACTN|nr:YihY/virulence factor BrkB family protein [Solirubrobacter ginsenosidimutans]MDA0166304.1 YihY/virulence factor BrkB family protein [Solirubrobacter ginsenosidimutans]